MAREWRSYVRDLALVGGLLLAARPARADDGPRTDGALDPSKRRIELTVGYGHTMYFAAHAEDDLDRQFVFTSPRLGLLSLSVDLDAPLRGTFEILAGFDVLSQFHPWGGYAFGFGPVFRYDFWTGTPVVPFVDFGFGIAPNDFGRPEQGGHWAFELQGGVGVQLFLDDWIALVFEYRFHHVSSAFIYAPNYGINSSVFSFGPAFFF